MSEAKPVPPTGVGLIAAERERQREVARYTDAHDDAENNYELSRAACCYAQVGHGGPYSHPNHLEPPDSWPWGDGWKPSADQVRNLTKAGALIAAEIDRLLRMRTQHEEELPDGTYQVRVHRAELDYSQSGDPMLKWDLIVIDGQHVGRHVVKNAVITHKTLPFIKSDLDTLGVRLPRFSKLPDHLYELLDQTLEITKRTRGEYIHIYFHRRLENVSRTIPVTATGMVCSNCGYPMHPNGACGLCRNCGESGGCS